MIKSVLITGAGGNLGGFLSHHLLATGLSLRLMVNKTRLRYSIDDFPNVSVVESDLGKPRMLDPTCVGMDCVVHLAGKLLTSNPGRDLPLNTTYTKNIITSAVRAGVKRFILVSSPLVEGPTGPRFMATDRTDKVPPTILARSLLASENALIEACKYSPMEPVILRSGMVYGKGVTMVKRARRLLERRLLGLWKDETLIHLISLPDFLMAAEAAIRKEGIRGIYNLGDDQPVELQEIIDRTARRWGEKFAWRAPRFFFHLGSKCIELFNRLLHRKPSINSDLIRSGMVPYVADTTRMKQELVSTLMFPSFNQGIELLK